MYTKEGCKFSAQLKEILESREIPYEETVIDYDTPEHEELVARTGSTRLPQAFVGVIPLGSTQEVQTANATGMLMDVVDDGL